ncbi:hypothetical protein SAMN05444274_101255 [Mariniphaga anaerophila]|uniref:Uncharacterized protein n=1 Tax=Mariniphaga anaerophila TaxID=1484053 RepID=A0A1M4T4H7_9BACT|nr:hypothetical protein SAMN05444274_101255 [Mariniphaga anaerophila]
MLLEFFYKGIRVEINFFYFGYIWLICSMLLVVSLPLIGYKYERRICH